MKTNVDGISLEVDFGNATYNGIRVMEIIKEACDLAHQGLIDLSTYRQNHNLGPQDEWELSELELDFIKFLDKLGD